MPAQRKSTPRTSRPTASDGAVQGELFSMPPSPERSAPTSLPPGAGKDPTSKPPARLTSLPDWSDLPPLPDGIKFGTSSWNYPGWRGQIYSRNYRASGDSTAMLEEYAQCPLFGCVGADSTFYRPPSLATLQAYRQAVPPGFEILGKVYDRITIQKFTHDDKWGDLAGQLNPDFLNPQLCIDEVIGPWLEQLGEHAGPLMFEFQTLYPPHRPSPEEWADMLFDFFDALPKHGRYGVELRNPELFTPVYLKALHAAGVAHIFNAWTRMPTIGEQLQMPGCLSAPFVIVRALLKQSRTYAEAVDTFKPYTHIQEPQPQVREDIVSLIERGLAEHRKLYILVNNRLEGNSPGTIRAIREMIRKRQMPLLNG